MCSVGGDLCSPAPHIHFAIFHYNTHMVRPCCHVCCFDTTPTLTVLVLSSICITHQGLNHAGSIPMGCSTVHEDNSEKGNKPNTKQQCKASLLLGKSVIHQESDRMYIVDHHSFKTVLHTVTTTYTTGYSMP